MENKIKVTKEEIKEALMEVLGALDLEELEDEGIEIPINMDNIKQSLNNLKGADIKNLLKIYNIQFEVQNNKEDNINCFLDNVYIIGENTSKDEPKSEDEINNNEFQKSNEDNSFEEDKIFNFREIQELVKVISQKNIIQECDEIGISNLEVYENMPIKFEDEFSMEKIENVYLGCAVIVNINNELIAVGKIKEVDNDFRLIFNEIKYDLLKNNRNCKVLLFEDKSKEFFNSEIKQSQIYSFDYKVYSVKFKAECKKLEEAQRPLCIDFGTSNTTVGSYGIKKDDNEIELVEFLDVMNGNESKLYPTIVYIKDCSDANNIEYLFGYEARKKVVESNYDTEASVFFEIKRWINDVEKLEEVNDENGNVINIKRKDIICAYISHIILLSEQYFKKKFRTLHFTAPVKLKNKFLNELEKMLSKQYDILKNEDSLDEGVAIVYNHIYDVIMRKKEKQQYSYNEDNSKNTSILIIDCGGGTTDLASCDYRFKKIDTGYELYINTQFENGNSNFGGNNITYRILQFLKIKLANYYCSEIGTKLDSLIPYTESDILENIDKENNNKSIYCKLEEVYKKAEDVIPTIFCDNKKFKFDRDIRSIKRNYYYLWQLAEKIKIEFFKHTDLLSVNFKNNSETNRNIILQDFNKFYLHIINQSNGKLEKKENIPDISINTKEISKLLYGDIYGLLNDLLKNIKPEEYKNYKLSGQSCKITLFNELLKEFIPGKKMRTTNTLKNKQSEILKLECINGSIAYIMDKELGNIKPHIHTENPKLIYDIKTERNNEDILMLDHNMNDFDITYYSSKADLALFKVYDLQDNLVKTIKYKIIHECSTGNITLSSIEEEIRKNSILSDEALKKLIDKLDKTDVEKVNKDDRVTCVFTVPAKDSYGFNIYQILKLNKGDKENYYLFNKAYENFEENLSSQTFFDGKK